MSLMRKPEDIKACIQAASSIALCAHVNPDGDTVGSVLALKMGLEQLGKQVEIFCQDKIPGSLSMLKGMEQFRLPETAADARFDLLMAIDVSDMGRLGTCAALLEKAAATAQIDHHGTNPCYMQVNSVDAHATATGLLIKQQLDVLGVKIDAEIAKCLYAAIATDSGNFAFNNVSDEAFEVMADLMRAGLPLSEMNRRLFRQKEKAQVLLTARALSSLQFHRGGCMTSMQLTMADFDACGALPEHADAIVNMGLDLQGVRMAVLARETQQGKVKMSLRAVEPDRVDGVARTFGGGGHAQASGCTLDAPMDEAVARVIAAMEKALCEDKA